MKKLLEIMDGVTLSIRTNKARENPIPYVEVCLIELFQDIRKAVEVFTDVMGKKNHVSALS